MRGQRSAGVNGLPIGCLPLRCDSEGDAREPALSPAPAQPRTCRVARRRRVRFNALMSASTPSQGEQVAAEVRRRRRQRNWTLDVAAARLGVSRRLLAQIEAGQSNPSLSTLLSIAAGFDMSLVELLSGADKPSITVQRRQRNRCGPVGGRPWRAGPVTGGSDPLELWEWTSGPGDVRRSDAHRSRLAKRCSSRRER